jgi:3-phosphoshikimate 1-carboxyvinyltransferase
MKIGRLQYQPHLINEEITLSSSKSLCNRLLVMQYLCHNAFKVENISSSADTKHLQNAIDKIKNGEKTINIGHAGTCMRFLTSVLSFQIGEWELGGSERMKERPIGVLCDALISIGADIKYLEKEGFPPLKINGKPLKGGKIIMKGSVSSQYVSSLLMIAPLLSDGLEIEFTDEPVSLPYLKMTLSLLNSLGVKSEVHDRCIKVSGNYLPGAHTAFWTEGDWSSASYLYSVCALQKGSKIKIHSLLKNSLQADSVLPQIYALFGVKTNYFASSVEIENTGSATSFFSYDFTNCPDIAQTLAVTCAALGVKAELSGLKTLRIKETDRIQALKNELSRLGAEVKIFGDDKIEINPHLFLKEKNKMYQLPTYHDHRMAMAFAPLAILHNGIIIESPEVVEKSYSEFWNDFEKLGIKINIEDI